MSLYKIACDHGGRGCPEVLEIGALQAHVRDCDFSPVSCSNDGCNDVVNKRDVKQHETELCRYRMTTCVDCGERMAYNKYGAHGCVLRRDVDEMKKDLTEMKATQNEMMNEMRESMKRMMTAIEKLTSVVYSMGCDIVVIAGRKAINKKPLSSVERLNVFKQTWTPLAELKEARYLHAAVAFESKLLACGGFTTEAKETTESIEVLDLNGHPPEWKKFSVNLPIKVAGHKCVVYGDRLLIIGGTSNGEVILDTIYELLLVPPYSSKLLCHMNKPRFAHGVELFNDKVLIAGGRGKKTDVEIFDITRNQCIEMPPLPSPVNFMATVRRHDTMLLIGGRSDETKFCNEIIEYDPKTGQSKTILVMKQERNGPSTVVHENTLVVIGGLGGDANAVDCFNFLTNSWKKLPPLTHGRYDASAVVMNKSSGF